MKKREKGQYRYLRYHRLCKLIGVIVFAAMIEFIVITMLLRFGTTSRVMVVFAILLSLPFAKFLIAFIMCAGFKALDEESVSKIDAVKNEYGIMLYDVGVSRYEGIRFYQALCVKNGKICALVSSKNFDEYKKDYEKWLAGCIPDEKYKYLIHIYSDVDAYIKKVASISEANENNRLVDKHISKIILDNSI